MIMKQKYTLLSLLTLALLLGSCSQEQPTTSRDAAAQEALHPAADRVAFDLQACLSSGAASEGRAVTFDEDNFSYKYHVYPGVASYNGGKTFRTHAFLYRYEESTTSYELVGYTKLSWAMTRAAGASGRVTMKVKENVPVQKASLSSDKSRIDISTTETVSITQGRKYRLLAINDDGGFDVHKPDATDYPEGAAPMFYFARGGNSPLESASLRLGQGEGLVAYVLEMDFLATETDAVTQKSTGGKLATFYPASPVLQVNLDFETLGLDYITPADAIECTLQAGGVAIASSCLTQHFGYTITGVGKPGERPVFTSVLKRLEAPLYQDAQSPLYRTTYEHLRYPQPSYQTLEKLNGEPLTFYLSLEPRFKQISSAADHGSFILGDGSMVSAPLVADGQLDFRVYLTRGSEALNISGTYPVPEPDGFGYNVFSYTNELTASILNSGAVVEGNDLRYQFTSGKRIRTDLQAIEYYWRNQRAVPRVRSSLNRLDISIRLAATGSANAI